MNTPKRSSRLRTRAAKYQDQGSDLFVSSDPNQPNERQTLHAALVKAKRSLLLDPDNYETAVLIGDIYSAFEDRGSANQAAEYYDRAIALEPRQPDAYSGKADLLMYQMNLPDEAERLARKSLSLSRQREEERDLLDLRYISLIGILEARGKFKEARWLIRQALRQSPSELLKGVAENTLKRIGTNSQS